MSTDRWLRTPFPHVMVTSSEMSVFLCFTVNLFLDIEVVLLLAHVCWRLQYKANTTPDEIKSFFVFLILAKQSVTRCAEICLNCRILQCDF